MNYKNKKPIAFILGPTASGKTELAISICDSIPVEIISVDSVMVYQDCDIGSAKPSKDILSKYPHHLVDCIQPNEIFSVADFYKASLKLIEDIHSRNKLPLFVGGTMMYFRSLIKGLDVLPERDEGYRAELNEIKKNGDTNVLYKVLQKQDPEYASTINKSDEKRIIRALEVQKTSGKPMSSLIGYQNKNHLSKQFSIHQYGIYDEDRTKIHQRIENRLRLIINDGLIDEVKNLLSKYKIPEEHPLRKSVNYKQAISFIKGEYENEEELFNRALYATRQLAKRQITWMRSWEDIELFDLKSCNKIKDSVKTLITSL